MRLLLDTHTLLWYAEGSPLLSTVALAAINSQDARSVVSAASLWEIAVKVSIRKLTLAEPLSDFWTRHEQNGVELLPISAPEATIIENLPFHHRDPFDRMIIAQSIAYRLPILSKDSMFDHYGVVRIW